MIVKNGKSKTVVEIEKSSSRVAEERDKKNTVSYELNEKKEEKEEVSPSIDRVDPLAAVVPPPAAAAAAKTSLPA